MEPIRVVAPSDQELWLRYATQAGVLERGGSHASAPALPQHAPAPPPAPYSAAHNLLPWQTSGADANTLRVRPLEGTSLLYNRSIRQESTATQRAEEHKEQVSRLAAQQQDDQYGMYAQNATQLVTAASLPRSSSAASQSVSEREQYLRKMQAIRQAMAQLSY